MSHSESCFTDRNGFIVEFNLIFVEEFSASVVKRNKSRDILMFEVMVDALGVVSLIEYSSSEISFDIMFFKRFN